jgi:acetoin utilization deacetylase AcuC-like enzyme
VFVCRPHTAFLPLPSSWAPVSRVSYQPWLDETDPEHVFFASINLHAGSDFYPCSGRDETVAEQEADPNIVNIALTPVGPGPFDPRTRKRITAAQRGEYCRTASLEFRRKVSERLLPRLKEFQPHLLFISSGFDAHYDDMYHWLTEEDFEWVTREMIGAVNYHGRSDVECAAAGKPAGYHYKGSCKVISVLEGGYSLSSTVAAESVSMVPPAADGAGKSVSNRIKKPSSKVVASSVPTQSDAAAENPFAIRLGDGGLVKGMLAHVSALVYTDSAIGNPKAVV